MKKVAYISLGANSWQRSALLDSAINLAATNGVEVSFFQLYMNEKSIIDLPFSSKLDYMRVKWQDRKLSEILISKNLQIETLQLKLDLRDVFLEEIDFEVGLEETIAKTRDSIPCRLHSELLVRSYAGLHHAIFRSARNFLQELRPDLLYVFNGRFYREKAFWRAASELSIETNFIERFSPTWHNRYFEFKSPVHDISYRCRIMQSFTQSYSQHHGRAKSEEVGFRWFAERIDGKAKNSLVSNGNNFRRPEGYSKQIVFFHSSEDELFVTKLGSTKWVNQISFLRELVEHVKLHPEIHLVVRLHPNLATKSPRDIRRWINFSKSNQGSNTTFLTHKSDVNSYDLIRSSDFVLTFGSTIGVEASYLGKSSILVSRAFHEHLNVTTNVADIDTLIDMVLGKKRAPDPRELQKNTITYGLFHAEGGIEFRHLQTLNRKESQDQAFQFAGVPLGTLKAISIVRRLEGFLYKFLGLYVRYNCRC